MNFDLLKTLCDAAGVPGQEHDLREIVRKEMADLCDEISTDVMGNVVCRKKGSGQRKVMIAAHMDEIGFVVRHIDDDGFVTLQGLGGHDPRQLFAQRVNVATRSGEILPGVLTYKTKPAHMLTPSEADQKPTIANFFVDLGMSADEVKDSVSIGDQVTMDRKLVRMGKNVSGKALDNRVGLFVMIEAMRALRDHDVDIYAVATVQEEIGLRGATTATFNIQPDIGIALDITLANDFPGISGPDQITKLGQGVGIKIMDASLVCHPKLVDHFRTIAEREEITHQMELLPAGGTDAGALQRAAGGTASITLSIPTRYVHTVNEMAAESDIEATIELLAKYLEEAHTGEYQL